jgi:hypothetical protein
LFNPCIASYTYQPFRSAGGALMTLITTSLMVYYITSTAVLWASTMPALQLESYRVLAPGYKAQAPHFAIQ